VDKVEFIAVIDGEIDRSKEEAKKVPGVTVVSYKENRGKGHALQVGFENAKGNVVIFIDADGDFNPDQIINFFPYLASADIVVGSKRHPFSKITYPFHRRVLSWGFHLLSKILLGINIRDTQSGLKIMKRQALEVILPLMVIKRYGFDLELCFLAQKHGFRTVEAPVTIDFKGTSTISPQVPYRMFLDLLAVRYRFTFLKYYQKKYHEINFKFPQPK
jgi:glycosyltransferase involved in cell wall biosynthesis